MLTFIPGSTNRRNHKIFTGMRILRSVSRLFSFTPTMKRRFSYTMFFLLLFCLPGFAALEDTATWQKVVPHIGYSVRKLPHPGAHIDHYLLYVPGKFRNRPIEKWPVIFFLHGKGERGNNINLVKHVGLTHRLGRERDFPFIVVIPQCKLSTNSWDVESLNVVYKDVIRRLPVDTHRVYLTGLSMGGYGTWLWANANPSLFAAIVPICGYGIRKLLPCNFRNLPVWTFHNTDDPTIGVEETRKIVRAIKACGSKLINYTERPTGGHDAWGEVYDGQAIFDWLLSKRRP